MYPCLIIIVIQLKLHNQICEMHLHLHIGFHIWWNEHHIWKKNYDQFEVSCTIIWTKQRHNRLLKCKSFHTACASWLPDTVESVSDVLFLQVLDEWKVFNSVSHLYKYVSLFFYFTLFHAFQCLNTFNNLLHRNPAVILNSHGQLGLLGCTMVQPKANQFQHQSLGKCQSGEFGAKFFCPRFFCSHDPLSHPRGTAKCARRVL